MIVGSALIPLIQGATFLWSGWDDGVGVGMLKHSLAGRLTKTGRETVSVRVLFIC